MERKVKNKTERTKEARQWQKEGNDERKNQKETPARDNLASEPCPTRSLSSGNKTKPLGGKNESARRDADVFARGGQALQPPLEGGLHLTTLTRPRALQ